MEITIFNYGAIVLFCTSLFVNFVFFVVLLSRFRSTKVKALQLLMLTSIFDIIIEILSLYQAFINIDNVISHYISTGTSIFNLFGILTAGTFLIFIDYFESSTFKTKNLLLFISTLIAHSFYVVIFLAHPTDVSWEMNSSAKFLFEFYYAIQLIVYY